MKRFSRRTMAICLAVLIVLTCATMSVVANLHRQGYCISQGRIVPEQEIFASAVKRAYSYMPVGVETLQDIRIGPEPTDGPPLQLRESFRSPESLSSRVDRMMADPAYRAACCKWGWDHIERGRPNAWEIFRGALPQGVVVTVNIATVAPDSIVPKPYKVPGNYDRWFSDIDRVRINGPIIWQQRQDVMIALDVCGNPAQLNY